jgi:predicted ATPase/class 3 adenylate cyclase
MGMEGKAVSARAPSGTVTFLFSDIEGSTLLLQRLGDRYAEVLSEQRRLLRDAFDQWGGTEVDTAGDGFFVVFESAKTAVAASVTAQQLVAAHQWPDNAVVRVRIGLHTGESASTASGYVGLDVHRTSRICSAGYGGQVLLSGVTRELVANDLPAGVEVRDLGEHRLKDLLRPERIFQLVIPGLQNVFPSLKTLSARPNNLPAQTSEIIGRDRDVEALKVLLLRNDVRLVTLTGPGGTGKTRLSLHVAASIIDEFDDGAFFVSLAPTVDPALLASSIVQALGIPESPTKSVPESLKDHLREKKVLLVLDNFEQVVDAAPFVADLVRTCSRLKVLVTSRVVLRLSGEREYPVEPLGLPDLKHLPSVESLSQYAAVELFIQRALAVKPDFMMNNENAPAVAEICYRLDGLPLAIELAAARIKLFSPQALLTRLGSRLDLLKGGARDLPARHQTLRQAVGWSYDLLNESEKLLFRRLAVFVSGSTIEAAEAVCNVKGDIGLDLIDGISALVDKSLLRQVDRPDGEPRFIMLETIREYGLETLVAGGEADDTQRVHAEYFLKLAEEAEPELTGPHQKNWLDRLEADHDNFRAALNWAEKNHAAESGLRLSGAIWRFWVVRGHMQEGLRRMTSLLSLSGAEARTAARAKALHGAATMMHEVSSYKAARSYIEESLSIYREIGDKKGIATELNNLSWVAIQTGESETGRTLSEEGLALHRELGDTRGMSVALNNLGWLAVFQGDLIVAVSLQREHLRLRRELSDRRGIAFAQTSLAWALELRGEYEKAVQLLTDAQATLNELRDNQILAFCLAILGMVAYDQGDFARAIALLEEGIPLMAGMGNKWGTGYQKAVLGKVFCRMGERARGVASFEEALLLFGEEGSKWGMSITLQCLGNEALERGDVGQACSFLSRSLQLHQEVGNKRGIAECLESAARVALHQNRSENAARLAGQAEAIRKSIGALLAPIDRGAHAEFIEKVKTNAAEEHFALGASLEMDEAVRFALNETLANHDVQTRGVKE